MTETEKIVWRNPEGEIHRDGDLPAVISKIIEYKSIILNKTVLLEEKIVSLEKELQNLKDSIKQILNV